MLKDYYYILGVSPSADAEEIKSAYRKLSLKFHPDKNEGDSFFLERFKEIQEAYEVLKDQAARHTYNEQRAHSFSKNTGENFNPFIERFAASKESFKYDEEITFRWKTINANNVILKPIGKVPVYGEKTIRLKDLKRPELQFELIAENANIGKKSNQIITLKNDSYEELYSHFKDIIEDKSKEAKVGSTKTIEGGLKMEPAEKWMVAVAMLMAILLIIYALPW